MHQRFMENTYPIKQLKPKWVVTNPVVAIGITQANYIAFLQYTSILETSFFCEIALQRLLLLK